MVGLILDLRGKKVISGLAAIAFHFKTEIRETNHNGTIMTVF